MTFTRNHQEWKERRSAERERNLASLCAPVKSLHRGTYSGSTAQAVPKREKAKGGRTAEMIHKGKLAQLGRMVCRRLFPYLQPGPVELHHLRSGGCGKGDYLTLIPLCVAHHRGDAGVHGMGTKAFERTYGFTQADLLMDALSLLEAK